MALDGMFLRKLALELNNILANSRIDNIDGLNKTDYSFKVRTKGENYTLYMSVSYNNPTIFLTKEKFEKPSVPSSFTMFLRKHLTGGIIKEIKQLNCDRVISIEVQTKDEMEGYKTKKIILELIGRFSNLLLLDNDNKVMDAVKQLSVLEEPSRPIMRGLEYIPLKNDKFKLDNAIQIQEHFLNIDNCNEKEISSKISGISSSLAKYLEKEFKNSNKDFYSFLIEKIDLFNPVKHLNDYYFFDIYNDGNVSSFKDLSGLLYDYYNNIAKEKSLKDSNQDIFKSIESNKKRLSKKLDRLSQDLIKAENAEEYRLKGELLQANAYSNIIKKKTIQVLNYYTNEIVDIDIDESKSIQVNSQLYYKKYKKAKTAISYIVREIDLAKLDLNYFNLLSFQAKRASLNDLKEIRDELSTNGYLKTKTPRSNSKKSKPNYLEYEINSCKIYVGKNNIQNNYLTHHFAKKDDLWFHAKDVSGSHVIVSGENKEQEDVIRFASLLAAKHSDASNSSSVPIDYTYIKYLKKVPGTKGSFVTYKTYKTIYVDPQRD